jgi:hypothetical protein
MIVNLLAVALAPGGCCLRLGCDVTTPTGLKIDGLKQLRYRIYVGEFQSTRAATEAIPCIITVYLR